MTFGIWLFATAFAQDECTEPFSRIQLGSEIGEIADALQVSDLVDAQQHVNVVHDRLPCLDEVVDKHLFALFARYDAVVFFYAQQEDDARRWEQASALAEPALAWDDHLFPPTHPVRKLLDGLEAPATVSLQEHGLLVPKGGGLFLSGDFQARPAAHDDLPGLVQVFDKSRRRVDGYWQEGARYLDRVLTDKVADVPPPAWFANGLGTGAALPPPRPAPAPAPPRPAPVAAAPRPVPVAALPAPVPAPKPARIHTGAKLPVIPLAVAGGFALVSGGTYALAGSWAAKLPTAQNETQLTQIRTNANLLVLTSGLSAAGAVGFGLGGFVLTGSF